VRVISGIADVDFHVGKVAREGDRLVVRSREGRGIPTAVHVSADDVVDAAKAVLSSPRALLFVVSAPFRRRRTGEIEASLRSAAEDDINNPWR